MTKTKIPPCQQCGKTLPKHYYGRGYAALGLFCTLRCGFQYAVDSLTAMDEHKHRIPDRAKAFKEWLHKNRY